MTPDPRPSLTSGGIVRPLIRLALPFMVGNVFSLLTLTVDRLWVGRVGTEALAALGTAHAAVMVLLTLVMGMSVGTLAGVSRTIGASEPIEAARYFGQGMLIALTLGVAMALGGFVLPERVMAFMDLEPTVSGPATEYLRINMWGMLLNAPLYVLTFALQGAGEARASLAVQVVGPVVNAVLDPIFIFALDLGVPGAAWASVISYAAGLAFGVWTLTRGRLRLRPQPGIFAPRPAIAWRVIAIGVPGTLEHLVRTVASFALVKLLTGFGATVLSAYTTGMVVLMTLIFPGLAVGQATASLVGQNLGARAPRRAWRTAWSAVGAYVLFMLAVGALVWLLAGPLVAVFDDNPAVVAEGRSLLRTIVLCFPFIGVALVLSKAFGGAGQTAPAMLAATVAHVVFQIPAVYLLGEWYGPHGAYWGMAAAFMVHGALSALLFTVKFGRWARAER